MRRPRATAATSGTYSGRAADPVLDQQAGHPLELTEVVGDQGQPFAASVRRDVQVIHGIDLAIGDGEFCVFVGASGCGKSTLLRMVAGLD